MARLQASFIRRPCWLRFHRAPSARYTATHRCVAAQIRCPVLPSRQPATPLRVRAPTTHLLLDGEAAAGYRQMLESRSRAPARVPTSGRSLPLSLRSILRRVSIYADSLFASPVVERLSPRDQWPHLTERFRQRDPCGEDWPPARGNPSTNGRGGTAVRSRWDRQHESWAILRII